MLFPPDRKSGFTLLELILAVAVISVLTAFLLSGISETTQAGKAAKCHAHLKALGTAHLAYAQDHGGILIPAAQTSNGYWYDFLPPYLGGEKVKWKGSYGGEIDTVPAWLTCPAKPGRIGYGWNQLFGSWAYDRTSGPDYDPKAFRRLSTITRPSNTLLHADSKDPGVEPGKAYEDHFLYRGASWRTRIATRHHSKGHYFFVDGHIEALTLEEVLKRPDIFLPDQ